MELRTAFPSLTFSSNSTSRSVFPENDAPRLPSVPATQALLAAILEMGVGWEEDRPLSSGLQNGVSGLDGALEALPLFQRSLLARRFGAANLAELVSLSKERDPEEFLRGMLQISRRIQNEGDSTLAPLLLQAAEQALVSQPEWRAGVAGSVQASVRSETAALRGEGGIGGRIEGLLRHFAREAVHPANLAGFAVGAAAFQSFRLIGLARLSAAPAGFLTRRWPALFLASALGTGAEATALTLANRSLRYALGEQHGQFGASFGNELLANGITLGFLRSSGRLAELSFNGFHGTGAAALGPIRFGAFSGISRALFPQAATLGALVAANRVEATLGLRPETRGSIMLVDSLATLLQFHVGGRIFSELRPQSFAAWTQGLELQSRWLATPTSRLGGGILGGPLGVSLALATGEPPRPRAVRGFEPLVVMSEGPKEEGDAATSGSSGASRSDVAASPVRFRHLFDEAPYPILVSDAQGDIFYANGLARQIFRPGWEALPGLLNTETFRPHPTEEGVYVWERGENDLRYWRLESHSLQGEESLTAHFLSDVTELQRMKADMAALEAENVRLAAKAELAERFFHDEGNVLAGVFSSEQLLERLLIGPGIADSPPSEGGRTRLRVAADQAKELGISMRQMLATYQSHRRLAAGQHEIKILSMTPMLDEALRLNESARQNLGISLVRDFGEEELTIRGEEALMINAVLNLLVNACHAMPNGGNLTVRTYPRGTDVVIEVSDSGTGIAPEHLPQIFDLRFTTRPHSGGTGLGLHNVKTAVENIHGGRVEVESQVGVGTTFRLYLPSSSVPAAITPRTSP
ncbi:MAG: hypothetical protein K8R69_06640 [Deltaproteobacteria bacterium]|nr:hypothetical protein [Deltaproteobacteria bacterium]